MPDKPTLLDTLETTRGLLAACRKAYLTTGISATCKTSTP